MASLGVGSGILPFSRTADLIYLTAGPVPLLHLDRSSQIAKFRSPEKEIDMRNVPHGLSANKVQIWKIDCAVFLLFLTAVIAAPAQTFTTLVNFNGANGAYPQPEGLLQGLDGNLYGTTDSGGANNAGTIFKMTPTGVLTTLHSFNTTDGASPAASLVQALNGNFFGVTQNGGASGSGTFFRMTPSGVLTTLHNFDGTDGSLPNSRLLIASDGNFYGTAAFGGNSGLCPSVLCGTIFKITASGVLTTVYNFCLQTGCQDGVTPFLGLAQASDGSFYGATWGGGTGNGGTIFRVTSQGALTSYSFCQAYPFCEINHPLNLVLGTDGNFYGLTEQAGVQGSFFKVTPAGAVTTLYNFCAQLACADGATPRGALSLGSDGNFYGTTYYGGVRNLGTVFRVTPTGVLTTLHSFRGADGSYPIGGVSQAKNGDFYGTTTSGGSGGQGTVFRLSLGVGSSN
jgi:uncharacterized repeat protein (TIGR03803 family)